MADDLDDFFNDVEEAVVKATTEEVEKEEEPPAKKQKVIRPQGAVVVAASSSAVVAAPAPAAPPPPPPPPAGPVGPQIPKQQQQHRPIHTPAIPPPPKPPPLPKKPHVRTAAGKTWVDKSLDDWPDDDFRIFVGSLGPEVTDQQLYEHFQKKYSSLQLAKIVRDNRTQASKCFGFVSFADALECAKALREQDQTWLGSRPIRLKRSTWKDREVAKKKKKKKNKR